MRMASRLRMTNDTMRDIVEGARTSDDVWLTIFKKSHRFDYDGYIWHHLRRYAPPHAVLAAYEMTWV